MLNSRKRSSRVLQFGKDAQGADGN